MSGHSKWSTIKHQKSANDAKRGKLFSKLAKDIAVAVREGGGPDPVTNPKLRLMIEKARGVNVPKSNIQRAIDKGAGEGEGTRLETIVYEGFGPQNLGTCIIECVTDNRNRCNQDVKAYLDKNGGRLGSSGAVSYLFEKKGWILVEKQGDEEEQTLKLIDCGAQDFESDQEGIILYTQPGQLHQVVGAIKKAGFAVKDAELIYQPKAEKLLEESQKEKVEKFLEGLDDLEDVQRIFTDVKLD